MHFPAWHYTYIKVMPLALFSMLVGVSVCVRRTNSFCPFKRNRCKFLQRIICVRMEKWKETCIFYLIEFIAARTAHRTHTQKKQAEKVGGNFKACKCIPVKNLHKHQQHQQHTHTDKQTAKIEKQFRFLFFATVIAVQRAKMKIIWNEILITSRGCLHFKYAFL